MNWINKQWHKVWLYLITLANNYLVGRNKEDAEQVTEPAPTPPVEKPTKPEPIDTRLANTLLVLDAGTIRKLLVKEVLNLNQKDKQLNGLTIEYLYKVCTIVFRYKIKKFKILLLM